jgi:predicted amino acid-binding ACT domain protein
VGAAVAGWGGNIDACSQTVLSGYFTLIMIVSFPERVEPDALCEAVRAGAADCQVIVRPFEAVELSEKRRPHGRFVITAFGKDKPGMLLRFSRYLAGKDINIIDLYGNRKGDDFVLISQVEIPDRLEIGMLQADLEHMGKEEGFTVRLQHENVFVATNQLRLTK